MIMLSNWSPAGAVVLSVFGVYSSFVVADVAFKHSTHASIEIAQDLKYEAYHPEPSFETFGKGLAMNLTFNTRDTRDLNSVAIAFVQSRLGIEASAVGYRSGFEVGDEKFAYVKQYHDGVPFVNAVANVAWKDDQIIAFGSSFVKPVTIAPSRPTVDAKSVISKAEAAFNGSYDLKPVRLEYLARPDGSAALVHVIHVRNTSQNRWFDVYVDAHSGEVLSATDFSVQASYTALPVWKADITQGVEHIVDPQDTLASPFGWHNFSGTQTNTTSGNNVVAYLGDVKNTTVQTSAGLVFDYPYDTKQDAQSLLNINAARTNAFYVVNTLHDFFYRYGFTEASFNFQNDNFGKGGKGGDRVQVSVQDALGINNAVFNVIEDGALSLATIFLFDKTTLERDADVQNDVLVHEISHGLTMRLVGGGTAKCLTTTESRGLGEGWSDTVAVWLQQTSAAVPDYVLGAYVLNDTAGIRNFPYSTNTTTNPLKYSRLSKTREFHNIGEVWANTLYNVYASLVATYGWSAIAKTNPNGKEGNVVFFHLFVDSLPLLPCNPTFLNARDGWIQADANRYGGANKCLLWKAFASRGLGTKAAGFVDDFTVPSDCQ